MQKYIITIIALWLTLAPSILLTKQDDDTKKDDDSKTVNICQGDVDPCTIGSVTVGKAPGIGQAGDRLSENDTNIPVESLGRITKTRQVNITIGAGKKIMAFTPTEGPQANKQIKVLFYAFDINNMPKGLSNPRIYQEATDGKTKFPWVKTMLKVYRQLSTETQWTEIIASFSQETFDKMSPITTYVYPDGRAKIYSPAHKDADGNQVAATFMIADLTKVF